MYQHDTVVSHQKCYPIGQMCSYLLVILLEARAGSAGLNNTLTKSRAACKSAR